MKRIILAIFVLTNLAFGDYLTDAIKTYQNGDYKKAVEILKKACDGANAESCAVLGAMYAQGQGVNQDYVKAAELFKKSCDGGIAESCGALGIMYEIGQGVKQDRYKAKQFLSKACDLKLESGCEYYKKLN